MIDKSLERFIYALLGFASIIIPSPIVSLICLVIAIAMLVSKIKAAKESREEFDLLMLDVIIAGIVILVCVGFSLFRILAISDVETYNYSSNSSSIYQGVDIQNVDMEELAEAAIALYQIENIEQFSNNSNNLNAIKNGFKTFLETEVGIYDIKINHNKLICNVASKQIVFTITKNDIKYSVK